MPGRLATPLIAIALVIAACPIEIDVVTDAGTAIIDAGTVADAGPTPAHELSAGPLPFGTRELGGPLPTSLVCAQCHADSPAASAMRDGAGRTVAPYDIWRASLMANAARDPFYLAQLAAEVQHAPPAAATIETGCLSCHSPLLFQQRA